MLIKCRSLLVGAALMTVVGVAIPPETAQGAIFSQDFESGLGAMESVGGAFAINTTNANNNGTNMMGHSGSYGGLVYDYYQISGISVGSTTTLEFDYVVAVEDQYDRFNLLAALTGTLNPPSGLLLPDSGIVYTTESVSSASVANLGNIAARSQSGHAVFDLSGFAGTSIDVRFQFGSDQNVSAAGVVFDNIVVANAASVPTPATIAMFGMALWGFGLAAMRRR